MPLWFFIPCAQAADLWVGPGQPFAEVEDAVNAASDGDRVLVLPGTYGSVAVDRDLELVGVGGAAVTTVGATQGPAMTIHGVSASVRGFTLDGRSDHRGLDLVSAKATFGDGRVVHGRTDADGACIRSEDTILVLERTVLEDCVAGVAGGALYATGGELTWLADTARDGRAPFKGGGVSLWGTEARFFGGTWERLVNESPDDSGGFGGALYANQGSTVVTGGVFRDGAVSSSRTDAGYGGAIRVLDGNLTVSWSTFDANYASAGGSGVSVAGSFLVASHLWLRGNDVQATPYGPEGGTLHCHRLSDCVVDASLFEGNTATDGAGLYADSPLRLTRSLFCGNQASEDAGAIDLGNADSAAIEVADNVIAGNRAASTGGAMVLADGYSFVHHNLFSGNEVGGMGSAVLSPFAPTVAGLILTHNVFTENDGPGFAVDLAPEQVLAADWNAYWRNSAADLSLYPATTDRFDLDPRLADAAGCTLEHLLGESTLERLLDQGDPAWPDADGSASELGPLRTATDLLLFQDQDGDGAPGMVDCDDARVDVFLGATEACDGVDNDCDGLVDAADDAPDGAWLHADQDGDGFGDPATARFACPAAALVADFLDCDDGEGQVNPLGDDEPGDGVDQDCDGTDGPLDSDGDGVPDADEVRMGTDPFDPDSDDDGVWDGRDPEPLSPGGADQGRAAPADFGFGFGCSQGPPSGASGLWLAVLLTLATTADRPSSSWRRR